MTAWFDQVHRFTVEEILRMVELGALPEDTRVELIDGLLIDRERPEPAVVWTVYRLRRLLERVLGDGAVVLEGKPVVVGTSSLPEPHLSVLPAEAVDRTRLPRANECLLVVEVAFGSLARDLAKAASYASAPVPVYWLVDLEAGELRVYEEPGRGGYRWLRTYRGHEEVEVPGTTQRVRVSEVLR
jgi:Uma2 family endonuclease